MWVSVWMFVCYWPTHTHIQLMYYNTVTSSKWQHVQRCRPRCLLTAHGNGHAVLSLPAFRPGLKLIPPVHCYCFARRCNRSVLAASLSGVMDHWVVCNSSGSDSEYAIGWVVSFNWMHIDNEYLLFQYRDLIIAEIFPMVSKLLGHALLISQYSLCVFDEVITGWYYDQQ